MDLLLSNLVVILTWGFFRNEKIPNDGACCGSGNGVDGDGGRGGGWDWK